MPSPPLATAAIGVQPAVAALARQLAADPDPLGDAFGALHLAADALEKVGFVVTDRRDKFMIDKVIGYVPCRRPALVRPPNSKLGMLHLAFEWAAFL